jgi:ATP-dependent Clp protease ATP-binding subunit ClpC
VFERFTERARQTIVLGQEEARRLGSSHIGTEHLLLGLIGEAEGTAGQAFARLGVTLDAARAQVAAEVPAGGGSPAGQIPFSPRAKATLDAAPRQALGLKDTEVGTEHMLLAMLIERDARTASILSSLGCPPDLLRTTLLEDRAAESPEDPADDGDVLLTLAEGANVAGRALADLGVTVEALEAAIERARHGS